MREVKIVRFSHKAICPSRVMIDSAGYDVCSAKKTEISVRSIKRVSTDIYFQMNTELVGKNVLVQFCP